MTNFCLFKAHTSTWTPTKDSKWTITDFTFLTIAFFHLNQMIRDQEECQEEKEANEDLPYEYMDCRRGMFDIGLEIPIN